MGNMKTGGLYEIRNLATGKRYVGSAINLQKRKRQHFAGLRAGRHKNVHLQASYAKHGEQAFVFRVICSNVAPDILVRLEQAALDVLLPKYNIAKRAQTSLGVRRSNATKEKIRRAMTGINRRSGYKHDEETRRKISASLRGNTNTLGRKWSEEARSRLTESRRTHRPAKTSGAHVLWHTGRGVTNPACDYCQMEK